ncbi:MAG: hypothetical protein HDR13_10940 [Lachnospiraceae bacterium]|nr:hypothetical protein [Lachnospiraceae bacterium]
MNEEQRKEYAEQLKAAAKEFIDGIGTDSESEQKVIKMIYGFVRKGFLETRAEKGGAV